MICMNIFQKKICKELVNILKSVQIISYWEGGVIGNYELFFFLVIMVIGIKIRESMCSEDIEGEKFFYIVGDQLSYIICLKQYEEFV